MSFDWKKHAECPYRAYGEVSGCNADRAEMIAEGERLQGLSDFLVLQNQRFRAENARLRETLEEIADGFGCSSRYGDGCDTECKSIARAALSGEVKPEPFTNVKVDECAVKKP